MTDLPLGKPVASPDSYAPEMLAAIPRRTSREAIGLGQALPFTGVDIWNAWELGWLAPGGTPVQAVAEISVPADSPNIVESKSLKLYLGSFAMSHYAGSSDVRETIATDLSATTGGPVDVTLRPADEPAFEVARLPGRCIDTPEVHCNAYTVDAGSLVVAVDDRVSDERLYSHLLRSLCPVTGQPDFASVLVRYSGPRIDPESLLRYVVSYRRHADFHEACVERMFVDLKERCGSDQLTVYARYTRRGGIDINPFRTDAGLDAENSRLWRQ